MSERATDDRAARQQFIDEAAAGQSPYLAVEIGGHLFFVAANGSRLQRKYFVTREAADIECLRLVAVLSKRRGLFVDVGANIGTTTVAALAEHGFESALAIEPHDENVRTLRINLAANGLSGRVRILEAAASDRPGRARLSLPPGGCPHLKTKAERVPTMRVRRIVLDQLGLDPRDVGLLWIDAAAGEEAVLAGASSLLEARVPVVTAIRPKLVKPWRARLLEFFAGYTRFYDVRPRGGSGLREGVGPVEVELESWLDRKGWKGCTDLLALE